MSNLAFTHGLVTSPNYLASLAGVDILRHGGNAIEACVAIALTLAVVYPHMCTLGGDGFWLIYAHDQDKLYGLNASGRSGDRATISTYQKLNHSVTIPKRGYLAANTVPGVLSGLEAAYNLSHKELNAQLSWASLFQSAILYSKEGFAVSPSLAAHSKAYYKQNKLAPESNPISKEFAKVFLPNGVPLEVGQIFYQPDLAATLERLAHEGAADFYQGLLAKQIVSDLEANGGLLGLEDFAEHTADWVEPLSVNYRGYRAFNLPPNTQGLASLEILNILNNIELAAYPEGSADYYHILIEASKEALRDRETYVSDPNWVNIPIDRLLSAKYGQAQAAKIDLNKAQDTCSTIDGRGDTVYVGCVDESGNAVSYIQSVYYSFGSAVVPKNTGLILQNRGCYFSLNPDHPNALRPKKRTMHTLNPAMLFANGRPYLIYGTMGGEGQPQTQAQLVTRVLDYHLPLTEAIAKPRFFYGRSWDKATNGLYLEGRIPVDVRNELARRGHNPIETLGDYSDLMGMAGLILCQDKALFGATDPRSDGLALGF